MVQTNVEQVENCELLCIFEVGHRSEADVALNLLVLACFPEAVLDLGCFEEVVADGAILRGDHHDRHACASAGGEHVK